MSVVREALQKAARELVRLKERVARLESTRRGTGFVPIAVTGMGLRFPGGLDDPASLWAALAEGRDLTGPFPEGRDWDLDALRDPASPLRSITERGGFLYDADRFDAEFFGISPREAEHIDPQQRVLLETSWEALERAGVVPRDLDGTRTGVFVGLIHTDYSGRLVATPEALTGHVGLGSFWGTGAGRLAHFLGLRGPVMTIDAACASSLVAIHSACLALAAGDCRLALAAGVTVMATPHIFVEFSRHGAMSPDGRCKAFGAGADGAGWAEGCGVLVLKRLDDAIAAGDRVLGVITGSAVNHAGRSQGLTAPNGESQRELIARALQVAGRAPEDIDVVEAHGTGTRLGDPIEGTALIASYARGRDAARPVWIGSIKSNIGHTQAAAGVAGAIKMLLAFERQSIPRTLHAEQPTPHVDWDGASARLLTTAVPWPRGRRARRAGVSAFGISGTGAHVLLEEPPVPSEAPAPPPPSDVVPLVLSARDLGALRAQAARLARFVRSGESPSIAELATALAVGRTHFESRLAVPPWRAASAPELAVVLDEFVATGACPDGAALTLPEHRPGKVAALFTGQGSQLPAAGRALHARCPVFRAAFDEACRHLDRHLDVDLASVVFADAGTELAALLHRTSYTQPGLFALEVALFRQWEAWGLRFDALIGYSLGELVAAHVAGALELADASELVVARGRLMQALPTCGAMASIAASESEVARAIAELAPTVSIAAVNGARQTVVSGAAASVQDVARHFVALGRSSTPLAVDRAFHSSELDPMLDELRRVVARLRFRAARIPIVSNVTGAWLSDHELASPEYWAQQARRAVRFRDGVSLLRDYGVRTYVECGPQSVLSGIARQCLEPTAARDALFVPSMRQRQDETRTLVQGLMALHVHGHPLDWRAITGRRAATVDGLPTYAFQRKRFWLRATELAAPKPAAATATCRPERFAVEWVPCGAVPERSAAPARRVVVTGRRHADVWRRLVREGDVPGAVGVVGVDVAPRDPSSWREWLAHTRVDAAGVDLVCDWGAIGDLEPDGDEGAAAMRLAESALHVLQALPQAAARGRLYWLTRGAQGESTTAPAQACLWGIGRTWQQERPDRPLVLVDLAHDAKGEDEIELLRRCIAPSAERQLRVANGALLTARLVPRPAPTRSDPIRFSDAKTYLLAGGLTGIGPHLAAWLVARGARRLVLAGRRGLETPGARVVVASLEKLGCAVRAVACDVSAPAEVDALVASIPGSAPLGGVFHLAGVIDNALISEQTPTKLEAALAPKARGAWNLHLATTEHGAIDWFVLFSSIASVVPTVGIANYAAANACLDALARRRRAEGRPGLAVCWGPWSDAGMSARAPDGGVRHLARQGIHAIPVPEVLEHLGAVMAGDETGIVVARLDPASPVLRALDPTAATAALAAGEREARGTASAPPMRGSARALVSEVVARVLRCDPGAVAFRRSFRDLGVDSMMSVELRDELSRRSGLDLPATLVFDHPNPEELAVFLERLASAPGDPSPGTPPSSSRLAPPPPPSTGFAVIGMACRLPGGADTPEAFWRLLEGNVHAVGEVPRERWDVDALFDAGLAAPGTTAVRSGAFLRDVAAFDAAFFDVSPREARKMDPQQRVLLEVTWEALERAAICPDELVESETGVFVGLNAQDYAQLMTRPTDYDGYVATGTSNAVASGRISYVLGLRGPSMTVDTACSSSLVALHLACQSLALGECSMAIVGGVSMMLTPTAFVEFSRLRGLARDGRCKAFDALADGTVWGEGCGVVVLKPLAAAQRDGDPICGVVRGTAVNQDGRSNGLTAPSGPAQERVIRRALDAAGVDPAEVGYVECHGTGTALGDPIEARALGSVFARTHRATDPLLIGSVKTNIGHTQAAAGVVGLMKVLLAMQHGTLPSTLHFATPSPHVPWSDLPLEVVARPRPWPRRERKLAGVTSLGISGTNAHAIIEEPPVRREAADGSDGAPRIDILPLSARSPAALGELASRFARALGDGAAFADACQTARVGRRHFAHRVAVVAADAGAAREQLAAHAALAVENGAAAGRPALRTVTVSLGRARDAASYDDLRRTFPAFEAEMERCRVVFAARRRAVEATRAAAVEADARAFSFELAMLATWRSLGVGPDACVARGLGELVAQCGAGVVSLEEAADRLISGSGAARAERAPSFPIHLDGADPAMHEAGAVVLDLGLAGAEASPMRRVLDDLARWFTAGGRVRFAAMRSAGRRAALPTYPFERERFWIDERPRADADGAPAVSPPDASAALSARLRAAPATEREGILRGWIAAAVDELVGRRAPSDATATTSLRDAGLDSFQFAELVTRVARALERDERGVLERALRAAATPASLAADLIAGTENDVRAPSAPRASRSDTAVEDVARVERSATLPGGRHVRFVRGRTDRPGLPVVLLHGIGANHRYFDALAAALPELDLIVPSMPGRCGSTPEALASADAAALWLHDVIAEVAGTPVVVLGHSYGGVVALELARRQSLGLVRTLVAGVVLVSTGPSATTARDLATGAAQAGAVVPTAASLYWLERTTGEALDARALAAAAEGLALTPTASLAADVAAAAQVRWAESELERITARVVLVTGEHDPLVVRADAEHLARRVPGCELVVLQGVGHHAPLETPGQLARHVRAFAAATTDAERVDGLSAR